MYVVIFRAAVKMLDEEYARTAASLRKLAFELGCVDFVSASEENNEITLSYWNDENDIKKWKVQADHLLAQELGRKQWYASYVVQVAKIGREYKFNA